MFLGSFFSNLAMENIQRLAVYGYRSPMNSTCFSITALRNIIFRTQCLASTRFLGVVTEATFVASSNQTWLARKRNINRRLNGTISLQNFAL